ncbi:MAG: hypothetical protein SGBAC_003287 [Bacillariaceae sp.]
MIASLIPKFRHLFWLILLISNSNSLIVPNHCLFSAQNSNSRIFSSSDDGGGSTIGIRSCAYPELKPVSDIVLQSFYEEKIKKSPWRRVYKLAEQNRLQQNYPYQDTDLHQMLVAVEERTDTVVGFVDIDARPCKTKMKLPRPYLSDLCVHEDFRRRGIANRLVKACEDFIEQIPRPELWIRVKGNNTGAIEMYKNLDYAITGQCENDAAVLVLHKQFEDAE